MSSADLGSELNKLRLDNVQHASYPAVIQQASGHVHGVLTEASSTSFVDKILITLSQEGRLSQWVQVPLFSDSPGSFDTVLRNHDQDSDSMLPLAHLTPMTLVGARGDQRETIGQLIACQIGTTVLNKDPKETRTVLVGLGLQNTEFGREGYFDVLELVHKVI